MTLLFAHLTAWAGAALDAHKTRNARTRLASTAVIGKVLRSFRRNYACQVIDPLALWPQTKKLMDVIKVNPICTVEREDGVCV